MKRGRFTFRAHLKIYVLIGNVHVPHSTLMDLALLKLFLKLSFFKNIIAQNVKILQFGNGKHFLVSFTFEIGMLCMQTKEIKHCLFVEVF